MLEHGWNSTSHQILDPGMLHWFSAAGDAVVGYVEVAGMRVVAGAPVASDERLAEVALEFEDDSRAAGRQVCYFAAENRLLLEVDPHRYTSHLIGLQPIWRAENWAQRFDGSASLRAQRSRALNKGVTVSEASSISERDGEVRACHEAWLASKGLPRLGFLAHSEVGDVEAGSVADRRLFIATRNAGGNALAPSEVTTSHTDSARSAAAGSAGHAAVVGYLSLAPVPRRHGWLVEKIVRHPRAPNGTTELLLDTALRAVADDSERFTLGLSPLARWSGEVADQSTAPTQVEAFDRPPAWLSLAENVALKGGRRFYDFAGLHAFKGKFKPDAWEPVYLVGTEDRMTLRTVVAVAGAFLGRHRGNQDASAQRGWWSMPS